MKEYLLANKQKLILGIILCLVATVMVFRHEHEGAKDSTSASRDKTVVLSISGEINAPGTYSVKYGSTIMENINIFGGFTANADINKVDVNAPLTKDTTLSVKSRSTSDSRDYNSLYELPD